jgi:hypothetical protein
VEGPKCKSTKIGGLVSKTCATNQYVPGLTLGRIRSGPLDRDPATAANFDEAAERGRWCTVAIPPA